jgi:hypothetical protein
MNTFFNIDYERFLDDFSINNESSSSDSDSSTSDSESLSSSDEEEYSKTHIYEKIMYLQKLLNIDDEISKHCEHMDNNFKINTECCSKVYCCSKEHNLDSDHFLETKNTIIICGYCNIEQKLTEYCIACSKKLKTNYACKKCFIFDNSDKFKFHCEKCNTCHYEEKNQLENCSVCNVCYLKNTKHICITLENNCSICLEELKNGTLINLSCGHIIHSNCYRELIKSSYKCPLCSKTIIDMKEEFAKLNEQIEQSRELDNTTIIKDIYCYDCEKKSQTLFSYLGLKCTYCKSFNTRVD